MAAAGELLEDVCTIHNLQRHVQHPTREENTLDLISSNYDDQTCCTVHPPIGQSDHSCVVADFSSLVDYNSASLLATSTIAQARQRHMTLLRQRISTVAPRGKQWWSPVKRAGGPSRIREVPVVVDQDGGQHSTNKAKAKCLGQSFSKKCSLGDEDFSDGVFPMLEAAPKINCSMSTSAFPLSAVPLGNWTLPRPRDQMESQPAVSNPAQMN